MKQIKNDNSRDQRDKGFNTNIVEHLMLAEMQ